MECYKETHHFILSAASPVRSSSSINNTEPQADPSASNTGPRVGPSTEHRAGPSSNTKLRAGPSSRKNGVPE